MQDPEVQKRKLFIEEARKNPDWLFKTVLPFGITRKNLGEISGWRIILTKDTPEEEVKDIRDKIIKAYKMGILPNFSVEKEQEKTLL